MIALETYDRKTIEAICSDSRIEGAVLGDLYCDYRMFENGGHELPEYAEMLKSAGKKVWLQTTAYIPDSIFSDRLRMLRYHAERGTVDAVLIQDPGFLKAAAAACPEVTKIWGYLGIARNHADNLLRYDYLMSVSDIFVASDIMEHADFMEKHGVPTVAMYGCPSFSTVNRICYYVYEKDLFGKDCSRGCLKGSCHLKAEQFGLDMSIDGYMLGKKYNYRDASAVISHARKYGRTILIYADSLDSCLARLAALEECDEDIRSDTRL